jgi:drug/metabolite transporter (DMT)-like permease
MALDVVALALLSAVLWGASEPVAKLGFERGGTPFQVALTVVFVSTVLYWVALAVQGQRILDQAVFVLGVFAFTGVLGTAIARVVSYTGVQRVGASVNSAGINTRPVVATVLAVIVLGESLALQTAIGIVIVVAGLIALAFSKGGDIRGWKVRDLVFPLGAATAFAIGNVLRRYGFTISDVSPLEGVALNETAGLIGLVVYIIVRHRGDVRGFLEAPRAAYAYFVGCGLLSAVALLSLFAALQRGRVVVVDPISSPTSLFALLFTAILLRDIERVTPRLILGVVLVVVGVVLITAPEVLAA